MQCGETRLVNLNRKRKKYKEFAKVKLFSYNMIFFIVKLSCYFYWGTFVYFSDYNLHFVMSSLVIRISSC